MLADAGEEGSEYVGSSDVEGCGCSVIEVCGVGAAAAWL